jgi:hypothetical protein
MVNMWLFHIAYNVQIFGGKTGVPPKDMVTNSFSNFLKNYIMRNLHIHNWD